MDNVFDLAQSPAQAALTEAAELLQDLEAEALLHARDALERLESAKLWTARFPTPEENRAERDKLIRKAARRFMATLLTDEWFDGLPRLEVYYDLPKADDQ